MARIKAQCPQCGHTFQASSIGEQRGGREEFARGGALADRTTGAELMARAMRTPAKQPQPIPDPVDLFDWRRDKATAARSPRGR